MRVAAGLAAAALAVLVADDGPLPAPYLGDDPGSFLILGDPPR